MDSTVCMEQVYLDCKALGLNAVARRLGTTCEQLVADLHDAGVMRGEGCPSHREIAERCRDVQRSWSDERPEPRREAEDSRAEGWWMGVEGRHWE